MYLSDIEKFREELLYKELAEERQGNKMAIELLMRKNNFDWEKLGAGIEILQELFFATEMPLYKMFDAMGELLKEQGNDDAANSVGLLWEELQFPDKIAD